MSDTYIAGFFITGMVIVYVIVVDELYGGRINKILNKSFIPNLMAAPVIVGGLLGMLFWFFSVTIPITLFSLLFILEDFFPKLGFFSAIFFRLIIAMLLYVYLFAIHQHFREKKNDV